MEANLTILILLGYYILIVLLTNLRKEGPFMWLGIGMALFIVGILIVWRCYQAEKKGINPGIIYPLGIAFIIIGIYIISSVYVYSLRDAGPPERNIGEETKSVLQIPLENKWYFLYLDEDDFL